MIDYASVKIENINFSAKGNDEIYQNLKILFTTIEGSVPFDPEFGININYIDAPIPIAQGRIIAEYTRKTRMFEPRVNVKEVNFITDELTGYLIPKVVINIVNSA